MNRIHTPLFALGASILMCAVPTRAASPEDPGVTIGGAVVVGMAHHDDGPRLDARMQVWLPPSLVPDTALRLGLEGAFLLVGAEELEGCDFVDRDVVLGPDAGAAVAAPCIEIAASGRFLVGGEWGDGPIARLELAAGLAWRQSIDPDLNDSADRWSSTVVGRAVGLVPVLRALGGDWRVGLSLEGSSFDAGMPVLGGGLVFEAVVID